MIEKIDARLARLASRHAELSQAIQNASVELAQVEGAHAHLTDLKQEIEEAVAAATPHAEAGPLLRAVQEAAAVEEADVFPVENALQRELARHRELARNAEATK